MDAADNALEEQVPHTTAVGAASPAIENNGAHPAGSGPGMDPKVCFGCAFASRVEKYTCNACDIGFCDVPGDLTCFKERLNGCNCGRIPAPEDAGSGQKSSNSSSSSSSSNSSSSGSSSAGADKDTCGFVALKKLGQRKV